MEREDFIKSELDKLRLPDGVGGLDVRTATMLDGEEYVLVNVRLHRNDLPQAQLVELVDEVQNVVASLDQRFSSVRFQEAA